MKQLKIGDYNFLVYLHSKIFNNKKTITNVVIVFLSLVIPVVYCGFTNRLLPNDKMSMVYLNDYVAFGFFGILFPVFILFSLRYIESVPNSLFSLYDKQIIINDRHQFNKTITSINRVSNSKWTILFWIPSIVIQLLWVIPIKNQGVITWLFYSEQSTSGAWAFQNVYFIIIAILFTDFLLYFILYVLVVTFFIWKLSINQVKVNPLHPDNCGGLAKIGHVGFLNATALIICGVGIALVFVSDNVQAHPPFSMPLHYLYLLVYVAATLLAFFLPLYFFKKPMEINKRSSLIYLRDLFETKYDQLPVLVNDLERQNALKTINELGGIKALYDLAKSMPVWPFNISTIEKFFVLFFIPFIVAYLPILIDKSIH